MISVAVLWAAWYLKGECDESHNKLVLTLMEQHEELVDELRAIKLNTYNTSAHTADISSSSECPPK